MEQRTSKGMEQREKPPKRTKSRPPDQWFEICAEFSKLRGQGLSKKDVLRALSELRNPDGSLRYGRIPMRCFDRRYPKFVRARIEELKKEYVEHCVETMEAYDLILRRAFGEQDHRLAKDTIRDKHDTGKDMGIYPRSAPERIEISGPSFFDAVALAVKTVRKEER